MDKNKSLGINAILNVIRTVLALVAPLITYPYVYRILGAKNLGSVNYTLSIVQYFVLFSGLGISTYGIREGAKKRDDIVKVSTFLSECFTINVIFTVVSYLSFIVVLFLFRNQENYLKLFGIQCFLIVFNTIGIEWINTVFEDYLYITIRTIIIQLLNIVLTFALIHNRGDYYIYAFITVVTNGIVSLLNWFHYKKNISLKITTKPNFKVHIKPIFVFFANKLAVTLYVSADTTMLGAMIDDYTVGIYSVAVKIYTILKNFLGAVYAVFLPRLAYTNSNDNSIQFKKIYSDLISIMTLLILPTSVGLFLLSKNIILLLFGSEYIEAKTSLSILSLAIIFSIYGGLVSGVYDVVKNLERITLKATLFSAVLNICLNFLLLPHFKEIGAASTTLLAELFTFIYCLTHSKGIKEYIDFQQIIVSFVHALIGCLEIIGIVFVILKILKNQFYICILAFILSFLGYSITLILLKNPHMKLIINRVKQKLIK